jgi:hypothetical protein
VSEIFDSQDFTFETSFPLVFPAKSGITALVCPRNGPISAIISLIGQYFRGLDIRRISESDAQNRRVEAEMWGDASRKYRKIFQGREWRKFNPVGRG